MTNDEANLKNTLFVASQEFFKEAVVDALTQTKVKATPLAEHYLVQLLEHYMATDRLFQEDSTGGQRSRETLAELFLRALNTTTPAIKVDLLKKLGDSSLYISGFFGDSLNRKLVDLDYYVEMGGNAYGTLASHVRDGSFRQVYSELAAQFPQFVDVLTYISTKTLVQTSEDLLRLYDRYLRTGSDLARDHLLEKGLIPVPRDGHNKKYES
ncbi:MAG TPA: hypothetical protein VFV50_09520 [Bdellovibrionales bacterium]|nr:hypothetical protein [Bdellovibrionales bacterium]